MADGLLDAPFQLLIVSRAQTQLFCQFFLSEFHFYTKLPDANDPKGEKQALVLSQKQDLLPQLPMFLPTGKSYQSVQQSTTSYGTYFVNSCGDSYTFIVS